MTNQPEKEWWEEHAIEREDGQVNPCSWQNLAYADQPTQEPEVYVPKVGDLIQVKAIVDFITPSGFGLRIYKDDENWIGLPPVPKEVLLGNASLISRPKPKLKLTMEQLREKVGDDFEIVN